jgi:hypothetical protein
MTTLAVEIEVPSITLVHVTDDTLSVDLSDGRTISVPLGWFPRLEHGNPKERSNWRLIGKGAGIHWEDLDEDLSVEGLIAGRPSGESQRSFKRWLQQREARPTST